MIQLYTGDGKGKTTAAVGQAVRGAGCGFRVIFAQFMKGNETGELSILRQVAGVKICRSSKQFGFYHTLSDADKAELTRIHNGILDEIWDDMQNQNCDMVILDEITYPVNWELLDGDKLKRILDCRGTEIVMTGRDAADFLSECADYITEMKCIRHPYEKGVAARKGIEY